MKMPEIPATIVGKVLYVKDIKEYENNVPTGRVLGAKVGLLGTDGATEVKLEPQHLSLTAPIPEDVVAWVVRFSAYSVDGNTGNSVTFLALADLSHVDALHNVVSGASVTASK